MSELYRQMRADSGGLLSHFAVILLLDLLLISPYVIVTIAGVIYDLIVEGFA